jgi:hypothetical protein
VLTMPGNWPDGIVGEGDTGTWNQEVLSRAGADIDFVDVHWYPGGATAAESLAKAEHIEDGVRLLREQLDIHAGRDVGISLTETNVGVGLNTQPGALFLADVYSGLLEQGVFTVQWWNVHNGIGTVSTVAGQRDYGDFGLLSSGGCTSDGTVCEPAMNTPFAPYHALKLLPRPGDQLVRAGTSDPLIAAHAARRPDGKLAVLLLNKDPDNAREVTIDYHGWEPAGSVPVVSTYANGAAAVTTAPAGTARAQTLPAYSLTLLTLQPVGAGAGRPRTPGLPTASAITDRTATISWPAAGPGLKYEVYRQHGGKSEQIGETTGTSLTAHNLLPGQTYVVNVVARDNAGRQSWSSAPVTFTTTGPHESACAVRLVRTTDWGNGFVWSLDITNNAAQPLTGWALTFNWPTTWQNMTSGWSATWQQTGTQVRVTSDATLAAGATTTVGFTGSYSGPNVPPRIFTLNGITCTTG